MHAAAVADKELLSELALESSNLFGHGRLGDVNFERGPRKAPVVGDGDEVAQLAKFIGVRDSASRQDLWQRCPDWGTVRAVHRTWEVLFRPGGPGVGAGAELVSAFVAEIESLYGAGFVARSPSATPRDFDRPNGAFLLGFVGGRPVACGGIKRLEADVAEIKRMYVTRPVRGRGVARWLLRALEDIARGLGYRIARLDTGSGQPHARALYASAGYAEISAYNANPYASWWGQKRLDEP